MKWSEVWKRKGVGSGKVLESRFELGTLLVQQRCMSLHKAIVTNKYYISIEIIVK